MNDSEFDLAARTWLGEGPTRMSDRAVLSILEEVHATRQRRALLPARRATPLRTIARLGFASVVVAAVGVLAINLVPRAWDRAIVGGPSSSPSPSTTLAVDVPDLTTTFVSARNGFSIKHPDQVLITPAADQWYPDSSTEDHWPDRGVDTVETRRYGAFNGASTRIPDAMERPLVDWASIDGWLNDPSVPRSCGGPLDQQAEITIDGALGRIVECPGEIVANVLAGGRLYRFTLADEPGDARTAFFDALAATIDLTPETAVDYPALDAMFVSPTYGYSFGYVDRGGLATAEAPWDPATPPYPDDPAVRGRQRGDRRDDPFFDRVETGHGAYFRAASTVIPDGVVIDSWVDEHVSAAPGCSRARSHQAEITIDGRSGRILECPDRIDATVVAGGRLYLFTLSHSRTDAKAFFDAWVATIDLTPETAAVPSMSPSR